MIILIENYRVLRPETCHFPLLLTNTCTVPLRHSSENNLDSYYKPYFKTNNIFTVIFETLKINHLNIKKRLIVTRFFRATGREV